MTARARQSSAPPSRPRTSASGPSVTRSSARRVARPARLPAGRVAGAERRGRALLRRRVGLVGLAAAGLAGLLWLLFGSSLLATRRVEVVGPVRLSAAQVATVAHVRLGTPLARVDTGAVAARVRRLAPVAEVSVTRHWPGALRIDVTERRPVAGVAAPGGFRLLDVTGLPFADAPVLPKGALRVEVAHAAPGDPSTAAALAVLRVLPGPLRARVRTLSARTPDQVVLALRDGRTVVWGGAADGPAKAAAAVALLRMPGRTFDVSAPGVVTRR